MAEYEIKAKMNLQNMIAEVCEVAQTLYEFADRLQEIENKYSDKEEHAMKILDYIIALY